MSGSGGVKIVFDVPEADLPNALATVTAAGFDVRRYYLPEQEHRQGGSAAGWIRLGAERSATDFSQAETDRVSAAFDRALEIAHRSGGLRAERVGIDTWQSGDAGGLGGVREPRRPVPQSRTGRLENAITS